MFECAAFCLSFTGAAVTQIVVGVAMLHPVAHQGLTLDWLLQHVHTQAEAMQEMEELISLDSNAMARRTNVRTRL